MSVTALAAVRLPSTLAHFTSSKVISTAWRSPVERAVLLACGGFETDDGLGLLG